MSNIVRYYRASRGSLISIAQRGKYRAVCWQYCAISCQSISTSGGERVAMVDKKSDKKFILEFIKVYHRLPALWDVKNKDYTNRIKKSEQYDVLIEKYREKYPNADKQDVVKKINSLRTNFRKELKRLRDAERSGAGAEHVKPSLWYFEEMRFLQSEDTGSTLYMINGNEDAVESGESEAQDRRPQKKMKNADPNEQLKMSCECLKQPSDDNDKIVAAWAVELRKMDPQQQLFAKKAINDIIFEGQMGTLHRNSVEINATPNNVQFLPPYYEHDSKVEPTS